MIYDLDGNPLKTFHYAMQAGETTSYQLKIDCRAGYFLYVTAVTNLVVEAKHPLDVDWTDVEADQIDLTPYAGNMTIFDFRQTASSAVPFLRKRFRIRVTR